MNSQFMRYYRLLQCLFLTWCCIMEVVCQPEFSFYPVFIYGIANKGPGCLEGLFYIMQAA